MDKLITNVKAGDLVTANVERWDPETWPSRVQGVGFTEAPRGALGHWLKIENTKIANYQCVVPTTWNGSPRDEQGNIGAFEAALVASSAVMHGLAHGSEIPATASAYSYLLGMVAATGVLHWLGLSLGLLIIRGNASLLLRMYGCATGLVGAWLLFA